MRLWLPCRKTASNGEEQKQRSCTEWACSQHETPKPGVYSGKPGIANRTSLQHIEFVVWYLRVHFGNNPVMGTWMRHRVGILTGYLMKNKKGLIVYGPVSLNSKQIVVYEKIVWAKCTLTLLQQIYYALQAKRKKKKDNLIVYPNEPLLYMQHISTRHRHSIAQPTPTTILTVHDALGRYSQSNTNPVHYYLSLHTIPQKDVCTS